MFVFDCFGVEIKVDIIMGSKFIGVFSCLGVILEIDEDLVWDSDNDSSSFVL